MFMCCKMTANEKTYNLTSVFMQSYLQTPDEWVKAIEVHSYVLCTIRVVCVQYRKESKQLLWSSLQGFSIVTLYCVPAFLAIIAILNVWQSAIKTFAIRSE